ncbi:variable surface protein [Plasmodium gonderi]|uniref:Variable surface protein n=1 Tax=Plasmodium gonderi TaxID=77519 RepID=A0A1Y1JWC4_PLAGO|nr:variable surface protein [Plasmodium gonderi]GAW84164.1 variable surface protein [Plasmodium gonderi]
MVDLTTEENDFDFTGIFPNCRNDFNYYWDRRFSERKQLYNDYSSVCSDYIKNIKAYKLGDMAFQTDCIKLGLYLNYIEDKNKSGKNFYLEASCKYFFYHLKDLVKKHGGNCKTTNNCYELFIKKNTTHGVSRISVPNICLQNANDNDIDENIFKILSLLDNLYNLIEIFKKREHRTYTNVKAFDSNMNSLEKYPATYNKSLNEELEKIFKEFKNFFKTWSTWWYGSSALPYFSKKWKDRNTFRHIEKSTNSGTYISASSIVNTSTETSANIEASTSMGTSAEVIFFCFAIISILFVLYKVKNKFLFIYYTTYGSFLQPRVRRLKKKFNKKNRNHQNLIDSFHRTKHNLNYNGYPIAYASEN